MTNPRSKILPFYAVLATAVFVAIVQDQNVAATGLIQNPLSKLHKSVALVGGGHGLLRNNGSNTGAVGNVFGIVKHAIKGLTKFSKRQALNPLTVAIPQVQSTHSESNAVLLQKLESCSCNDAALKYGHDHVCEIMVHEIFCELNKLIHYTSIVSKTLKTEMKSHLKLLFNITEEAILFKQLINNESLTEVIETEILQFEEFIKNPENLEIIIETLKEAIPVIGLVKTVIRLRFTFLKLFTHIHGVLGFLEIPPELFTGFKFLTENVIVVKENILKFILGHLLTPVQETMRILFKVFAQALSVLSNFEVHIRTRFYKYLTVVEEIIEVTHAVYNGYCASGFPNVLDAQPSSTNEFSGLYPTAKDSSTANDWMSSLIPTTSPPENGILRFFSGLPRMNLATVGNQQQSSFPEPVITNYLPIPTIKDGSSDPNESSTPIPNTNLPADNNDASEYLSSGFLPIGVTGNPRDVFANFPQFASLSSTTATLPSSKTTVRSSTINEQPDDNPPLLSLPLLQPKTSPIGSSSLFPRSESSTGTKPAASFIPPVFAQFFDPSSELLTSHAKGPANDHNYSSAVSDPVASSNPPNPIMDASSTNFKPQDVDPRFSIQSSQLPYANQKMSVLPRAPEKSPKVFELDIPSSSNPPHCGSATFLPTTSNLDTLLKNITSSQVPVYLPRNKISTALSNIKLQPGDVVTIFLKNDTGLIGQVVDTVNPIYFKVYKIKSIFLDTQGGVKIWHLRSTEFANPSCEHELQALLRDD